MIQHTFGLLTKPGSQWRTIADLPEKSLNMLVLYPCLLALLPAVAWYYGTSQVGWTVGGEQGACFACEHDSDTLDDRADRHDRGDSDGDTQEEEQ